MVGPAGSPGKSPSNVIYGGSMERLLQACLNVRRCRMSHSSVAKQLSHIALSYASPTEPVDGGCRPPCSAPRRQPRYTASPDPNGGSRPAAAAARRPCSAHRARQARAGRPPWPMGSSLGRRPRNSGHCREMGPTPRGRHDARLRGVALGILGLSQRPRAFLMKRAAVAVPRPRASSGHGCGASKSFRSWSDRGRSRRPLSLGEFLSSRGGLQLEPARMQDGFRVA